MIDDQLPWSPHCLSEYKLESFEDFATIEGLVRFYSYRDRLVPSRIVKWCRKLKEPCQVFQFFQEVDGILMRHRIGGPAVYVFDEESCKIKEMEFFYMGNKYSAFNYYDAMIEELPNVFVVRYESLRPLGKSDTHEIVSIFFASHYQVQCPYKLYYKKKALEWRIGKRKMGMYEYYTIMEQQFSGLRKHHYYRKGKKFRFG